jgi:hypothetical protein
MKIDESLDIPANAGHPRDESRDPGSNETIRRERQCEKPAFGLSSVTDEGIQIDESDEQPSTSPHSIRLSFEPGSNVNDERDRHPQKQHSPSLSTDEGMQTDPSIEQ